LGGTTSQDYYQSGKETVHNVMDDFAFTGVIAIIEPVSPSSIETFQRRLLEVDIPSRFCGTRYETRS
jgi:hypothetical protein